MVDLHPTTHLQAAAWVPDDDPERPWDEAADLAAEWIWGRSEIEGLEPLLVPTPSGTPRALRVWRRSLSRADRPPRRVSSDSSAVRCWRTSLTSGP